MSGPIEQVHDVYTPIGSPEPELSEEEERPLTPPLETPRKEVIVVQQVQEVKVMSGFM